MRGGDDPGHVRFRPRVARAVYVWKDLLSGDGTFSSLQDRHGDQSFTFFSLNRG